MASGKTALIIVRKYHPNVARVVDAKRPIHVTVTAADCKSAKKGAPSQCAMARAFSREFDGAVISKAVSYLIKGTTAYRYTTPQSVVREIVSFDRHKDFRPGDYGLNAPSTSSTLANSRSRYAAAAVAETSVHEFRPQAQPLGKIHGAVVTGGHKPDKGLRKFIHKTAGVRSL